jgi:hypothetical protein
VVSAALPGAPSECNLLEGRIWVHGAGCALHLLKPASFRTDHSRALANESASFDSTAIISWPLLHTSPRLKMKKGYGQHASRRFRFVRKSAAHMQSAAFAARPPHDSQSHSLTCGMVGSACLSSGLHEERHILPQWRSGHLELRTTY